MKMQSAYDVLVIGGNADGLVLATALAEAGRTTAVLEASMKAGGELLTESFLTTHQYNLTGGWQLSDSLAELPITGFGDYDKRLLLPEVPLAFLFAKQDPLIFDRSFQHLRSQVLADDRDPLSVLLEAGDCLHGTINENLSGRAGTSGTRTSQQSAVANRTVKQVLDDLGFRDARLRCALTYLPLALGCDIESRGSAAMLAYLLSGLRRLSVMDGGSGLLVNSLRDRLAVGGGVIIESARIRCIETASGNTKSVHLEDGRVFTAPVIVFARGYDDYEKTCTKNSLIDQVEQQPGGVYRIYLDFTQNPAGFNCPEADNKILRQAYMVGFGFDREEDIYQYLRVTQGQLPFVAGHLINNSFEIKNRLGTVESQQGEFWRTLCKRKGAEQLNQQGGTSPANNEPTLPGDDSLGVRQQPRPMIWQGVLPGSMKIPDKEGFRKFLQAACVNKITQTISGIEKKDLRFCLTWLTSETKQPLLQIDLVGMAEDRQLEKQYRVKEPGVYVNRYAALSRFTGLHSGLKLYSILQTA